MDNISYEQLIENLNSLFQNYTKIELTIKNIPKVGINGFFDLRYVKEDIIDLYSLFTDAFLLRRILDKNYIKKSIIYSVGEFLLNSANL